MAQVANVAFYTSRAGSLLQFRQDNMRQQLVSSKGTCALCFTRMRWRVKFRQVVPSRKSYAVPRERVLFR